MTRYNKMLDLVCEHCHQPFSRALDHGKVPRFCSRACFIADKFIPEEERTCPVCSTKFISKVSGKDAKVCCNKKCTIKYFLQNPETKENHPRYRGEAETHEKRICQNPNCGKEYSILKTAVKKDGSSFCSQECWREVSMREREICTCKFCHKEFTGIVEEHRLYCSRECYFNDHSGEYVEKDCAQCYKKFNVLKTIAEATPRSYSVCSDACKKLYYQGDKANNWKGGRVKTHDNGVRIYGIRNDRKTRYVGEHRLICERIIGRQLHRTEIVLRLDRDTDNNSPENLFVCKDLHVAGKYIHGGWEWPRRSNLDVYR